MKFSTTGQFQLLAVTRAADAQLALQALDHTGARALSVETAGLAAVLVPVRRSFWRAKNRGHVTLAAFQRQLEALHSAIDVLPAAPGAILADTESAERLLIGSAPSLRQGLERFSGSEQHQILIELPGDALFRRLSGNPQMIEARKLAEAGQRLEASRAVQRVTRAARDKQRAEWVQRLAEVGMDWVALPQPSEETVTHLALLAPRSADAAIEAVLREIDEEWGGALQIQMVGPSPVSFFGSVLAETPEPERLQAASLRLGAAPEDGVAALKAAYRTTMKRLHSDAARTAVEQVRQATVAQAELLPVAQAWDALRTAGMIEDAAPLLLARLYREGDRRENDLDAWRRDVELEVEGAACAAGLVESARQGVA